MTLATALQLVQRRAEIRPRHKVFLACGFQPLHLTTFLQAHFAERFPDQAADIQTGLYGDLEGTLERTAESDAEAAAVVIEWSDLDPRLGFRSSGGWGPSVEADILATCRHRREQYLKRLEGIASKMPVAVALPSLPVSLLGHTPGRQLSAAQAELELQVAALAADAAKLPRVRVLSPSHLAQTSRPANRADVSLELRAGFPYTLDHASALAMELVHLIYPRTPMKGLITDLDDCLWAGLVGEVGPLGVGWSIAAHAQAHGLYQQELRQLSEMGVLLAVASKNDPAIAERALSRGDLYLPRTALFPVVANWQPKSQAIEQILRLWNIGADSVVFVDDSPMELAEVRSVWPAMTCLQFPAGSPAKIVDFLGHLRDLFGKSSLNSDDALRQNSIVANARFQEIARSQTNADFLRDLQGKVTIEVQEDASNPRLLELINKTNQFNLNGRRLSEAEWLRLVDCPNRVILAVSYEDKFGPLGVIGVLAGHQLGDRVAVTSWVLSCRAFSRRIEFHILDYLFRCHGVETISLAFMPTDRNHPLQEFLRSISIPIDAERDCILSRAAFCSAGYELPHQVAVAGDRSAVLLGNAGGTHVPR
jgi:FkbH-like protein